MKPRAVGPANYTCQLQLAELLGSAEFVWIQAAGFGEHGAASCLDGVLNPVLGVGGTITLLEEARKFSEQLFYL